MDNSCGVHIGVNFHSHLVRILGGFKGRCSSGERDAGGKDCDRYWIDQRDGLGIAHALASSGANIVLNGFGESDDVKRLVSDISGQHNVGAIYSKADISQPDQIAEMIDEARKDFGAVDILVNNAGIQHVAPIEEFPIEKWNAIIAINLSGAFTPAVSWCRE